MLLTITIDCEVHDEDVAEDIIHTLETVLPYMASNVLVTSKTDVL